VLAVTLLLTVTAATLSYYLLEAPALRLKSRGPSMSRATASTVVDDRLAAHDPDVGVGVEAQG